MPEVRHTAPQLSAPWGQSWGGGGRRRRRRRGGEEERRGGGEEGGRRGGEEERWRRREGGKEERERDIIKLTHKQVRRGLIYASQCQHKFCTYKNLKHA